MAPGSGGGEAAIAHALSLHGIRQERSPSFMPPLSGIHWCGEVDEARDHWSFLSTVVLPQSCSKSTGTSSVNPTRKTNRSSKLKDKYISSWILSYKWIGWGPCDFQLKVGSGRDTALESSRSGWSIALIISCRLPTNRLMGLLRSSFRLVRTSSAVCRAFAKLLKHEEKSIRIPSRLLQPARFTIY